MNVKLGLAVLGGLILAAVAIAVFPRPAPGPVPRAAPELPPSEEEARASFRSDQADFEAHRDLVLAMASPNVALQSDFFAWGESEQRTEMNPDSWTAGPPQADRAARDCAPSLPQAEADAADQ